MWPRLVLLILCELGADGINLHSTQKSACNCNFRMTFEKVDLPVAAPTRRNVTLQATREPDIPNEECSPDNPHSSKLPSIPSQSPKPASLSVAEAVKSGSRKKDAKRCSDSRKPPAKICQGLQHVDSQGIGARGLGAASRVKNSRKNDTCPLRLQFGQEARGNFKEVRCARFLDGGCRAGLLCFGPRQHCTQI